MTGGIGRKALSAFYRDHFIFAYALSNRFDPPNTLLPSFQYLSNPADTRMQTVSRTVGPDRVVGSPFLFSLVRLEPY